MVIGSSAHARETVSIAPPFVTIADFSRVRVDAEVAEIDFQGIDHGAVAIFSAEGFPGRAWRGRVGEVPDVVVGRQFRPRDTRRPVDTRILVVKVEPLEPTPLKLGRRVEVRISRPSRSEAAHSERSPEV